MKRKKKNAGICSDVKKMEHRRFELRGGYPETRIKPEQYRSAKGKAVITVKAGKKKVKIKVNVTK